MANYDQEIYEAAKSEGFSDTASKLIVAQARLESADYTSNVFKNNFNMFGMKYIGQPLAVAGTKAPSNEGSLVYAKYKSPADSTKDLVGRLYKITRAGVSFDDLKNVKTPAEFATKLKQRGYFGVTASHYEKLLSSKLTKIKIVEFIKKNPKTSITVVIGVVALSVYGFFYLKKVLK